MKTSFLNLHEVILILTTAETLFLCFLLRQIPSRQPQARQWLALFFLLVAVILSTTLITWNGYLQTQSIAHWSLVPLLLSVSQMLQGPVLFYYLRSLSEPLRLRSWEVIAHLSPAVVIALVILLVGVNVTDWLPWSWPSLTPLERGAVKFVWAVVRCSPFIYILACLYEEYRRRQQWKQRYSNFAVRELMMADVVLSGFLVNWLWSFVGYWVGGYLTPEQNDLVGVLNNYLTVIMVNLLFVFGLLNTRELFQELPSPVEESSASDQLRFSRRISAIEMALVEHKYYLDSQINLERLAERLGLRPRDLSSLINAHYQVNFFEFINGYRIEEAKRLLVAAESQGDTILDIVYKSGFNSQSAFQRFFKRIVGMTPSEYRLRYRQTGELGVATS